VTDTVTFTEILHPVVEQRLERCDAVLRVGGPSVGADQFVAVARDQGLFVFSSLDEVPVAGRGSSVEPA
jgi:hypothetical protein